MRIPKEVWKECKICNKKLNGFQIEKNEKNKKAKRLIAHLTEHSISIEDYIEKYYNIIRPYCQCGCGTKLNLNIGQARIHYKSFLFGDGIHHTSKWSDEAKKNRCGVGNPMKNKKAWNKGLTKESNINMKMAAEKMRGIKKSPEHIEKIRQRAIDYIKNQTYKSTMTTPHIIVNSILKDLNINYINEYQIGGFLFDIYLPDYNILIEIDGDYWHSNPIKYPDGPITYAQIKIKKQDNKKNGYCKLKNLNLKRFWEYDIINHKDKIKEYLCNLKKL